jgi:RHS repeat-associated protein
LTRPRHDYLPYGEELSAGIGGRSVAQGYTASDSVRQQFTQKERDVETGLDYFLARYYSSVQGRFTSPDEFKGGAYEFWLLGDPSAGEKQALPFGDIRLPQSHNKYQYCFNNPLKFIDPNGHDALYMENKDTGKTTIVIPVHFTGPSATPGLIADVVSRASQLNTGDSSVKIEIVATDKPIHGVLNTMNLSPDLDPKYPKGEGTKGKGGNTAHIRSNGVGSGGAIVHDTLHFAGLKDRYKEGWTMSQKRKPTKPTNGYDNSNIMTSSGGTTLKPEQIREAKDNKSTKKCITENGGTKCK